MASIFYVDSENVGDSWIELLDMEENKKSDFRIFYTGKSPRIAYSQAIKLMNAEKKPEFIECYEGNNGLDFQLVTYLGYELKSNSKKDLTIVSNDTGFDAIVHFWVDRGMSVKRMPLPNNLSSLTKQANIPVSDSAKVASALPAEAQISPNRNDEINAIVNCIGKNNKADINQALMRFYGNEEGGEIYKKLKSNKFSVPTVEWDKETRVRKLINLIICYSNVETSNYPEDFTSYLYSNVVGDAKQMATKINKVCGGCGPSINKVFKPFYKTLFKIKNK